MKLNLRTLRLTLIALVILVSATTFSAIPDAQARTQPTPLEAILYNSNLGEIIAVNHMGSELERTRLPSLGSQTFSDSIEVSDDGNRIAYVLTDTNSRAKDLMIYDRTQDTVVGQYRIPTQPNDRVTTSLDFATRSSAFGPAMNRFVLGYSINHQDWYLVIYNISRGMPISTIDHTTHPTLPGQTGQLPDLPMPRQFDGQFVDFTLIATGTEGMPEYPAFRWNTQSNNVQQNPVFSDLDSDYLGSEHVLTVPDYSLPNVNNQIRAPFPQINAVYAASNDTGSTFPVHANKNLSFYQPRFIENGRRVAVSAGQALNSGQPGWHVLDRAGNVVGLLVLSPYGCEA